MTNNAALKALYPSLAYDNDCPEGVTDRLDTLTLCAVAYFDALHPSLASKCIGDVTYWAMGVEHYKFVPMAWRSIRGVILTHDRAGEPVVTLRP